IGSMEVRSSTARITVAASSSTGTERRDPPKAPTAVRTGLTTAALLIAVNLRRDCYPITGQTHYSPAGSDRRDGRWRSSLEFAPPRRSVGPRCLLVDLGDHRPCVRQCRYQILMGNAET